MSDEIWNMLNILGYKAEEQKKLVINDFVRQLYINVESVPQSDPLKLILTWGERAKIEFSKKEVLSFASKVQKIQFFAHSGICKFSLFFTIFVSSF